MRGIVVSYDRCNGYGFIQPEKEGEKEVYVYWKDIIVSDNKPPALEPGCEVQFVINKTGSGSAKAEEVKIISTKCEDEEREVGEDPTFDIARKNLGKSVGDFQVTDEGIETNGMDNWNEEVRFARENVVVTEGLQRAVEPVKFQVRGDVLVRHVQKENRLSSEEMRIAVTNWNHQERPDQRPIKRHWEPPATRKPPMPWHRPVRTERIERPNQPPVPMQNNGLNVVENFRWNMSDHFARKNWKNIAPAVVQPHKLGWDSMSSGGSNPERKTLHKWIYWKEGAGEDDVTGEATDMYEIRMPGKRLIRILYETQTEALDKIYEQLTQKPADMQQRYSEIPMVVIEKLRALAENDLKINLGGYFIPGWGEKKMPSFQERYYEYFHEVLRYWEFGNFHWIHEFLEAVCKKDRNLELHGYEGMDGAWFGLRSDLQEKKKREPKDRPQVDIDLVKRRISNFMARQRAPIIFKQFRRQYARSQGKSHALAPTKWGFLDTSDMIKTFASQGAPVDVWERKSTRYVVHTQNHLHHWRRRGEPPDWEHLL